VAPLLAALAPHAIPRGIAAVLGVCGLVFWRWNAAVTTEYARLVREACVALNTHAPAITSVSVYEGKPPEGEQAREDARNVLRRIADELSEAVAPPEVITWLRGLPPSDDAHAAGKTIRGLSNNLTASGLDVIAWGPSAPPDEDTST